MSFFTNVTRTKITGIGTASWTTIDLSTFVSVPTGATAAFLCFDTVTTLGTTHGARKVGSADTFTNASLTRLKNYKLIELSGASVELYVGNNTNGEWYIESFDTHFTFLATAVEKGGSVTGGTYTLDYSTDLPADAASGTAVMEISRTTRIGAFGSVPSFTTQPIPRTLVFVPLDASRRAQYISAGGTTLNSDLRLIGWAKAGAVVHPTSWTQRTLGSTATWTTLTDTSSQVAMGMWRLASSTDNVFYGLRAVGDANADVATSLQQRFAYSRLGTAGDTEANVSNVGIGFYFFGGIVPSLAPATILTIDQLISGSTSRVTLDNTAFSVTVISITDGSVTKTASATLVSAGVYDFDCPSWVDGETGLLYGPVNVTASNGVEATPNYPITLSPASGLATQIADSISTYNYGAGWTPQLKIGTQALYVAAQVYVFEDMTIESVGGYTGLTAIWDRDPDDYIARTANVIVGSETTGSGLTSSGLTHRGFTISGLTHTGL